jgi:hypothetical protein
LGGYRRGLLAGVEDGAGRPQHGDNRDDGRHDAGGRGQKSFRPRSNGGVDHHDGRRSVDECYLGVDADEFSTPDDDEADGDNDDHQACTGR